MGRSNTTARDLLSAVKTTWPLARNIYLLARDGETPELPGLRMQGATTENIEQREMIAAVMALTLTQAIVTGDNIKPIFRAKGICQCRARIERRQYDRIKAKALPVLR